MLVYSLLKLRGLHSWFGVDNINTVVCAVVNAAQANIRLAVQHFVNGQFNAIDRCAAALVGLNVAKLVSNMQA